MFATYYSRYPSANYDAQRVEIIGPISANLYRIRFVDSGIEAYAERSELSDFGVVRVRGGE